MSQIQKLRDEYQNVETQLFEQRKNYKQVEAQFLALVEVEKTFGDQLKKLNEKYDESLGKLNLRDSQLKDFESLLSSILRLLDKSTKAATDLDSTLSCLSCLEYLKDPQTLLCGHSICRKCFETHSDPKSKDSLVFCEECKIETKNKMLKEQQVMTLICDRYGTYRENFKKIRELIEAK